MRLLLGIASACCALLAMSGLAYALVRIDVDLSTQTMHVATGDGESYDWPISSGKAGHLTPRGRYRPTRLFPIVYSSKTTMRRCPTRSFSTGNMQSMAPTRLARSAGRPRTAAFGCRRPTPRFSTPRFARKAPQFRSSAQRRRKGPPSPCAIAAITRRRWPMRPVAACVRSRNGPSIRREANKPSRLPVSLLPKVVTILVANQLSRFEPL